MRAAVKIDASQIPDSADPAAANPIGTNMIRVHAPSANSRGSSASVPIAQRGLPR